MTDKYVVIKLGGAQHLLKMGDIFEVNRLSTPKDESITITDVLLIQDGAKVKIGTPLVEKSSVTLKVLDHLRGKKVVTQTYKSKSRYRRKVGHRQELTKVEVVKIS